MLWQMIRSPSAGKAFDSGPLCFAVMYILHLLLRAMGGDRDEIMNTDFKSCTCQAACFVEERGFWLCSSLRTSSGENSVNLLHREVAPAS